MYIRLYSKYELHFHLSILFFQMNTFLSIYIALSCQRFCNTRNGIISLSIYCLNTLYGYFVWCIVHSLFLEIRSSIANERNMGMNQLQSVSERRQSYLRSPSLPTYDRVMCSESHLISFEQTPREYNNQIDLRNMEPTTEHLENLTLTTIEENESNQPSHLNQMSMETSFEQPPPPSCPPYSALRWPGKDSFIFGPIFHQSSCWLV